MPNTVQKLRTDRELPDGTIIDLYLYQSNGNHYLSDGGETLRWIRDCSVDGTLTEETRQAAELIIDRHIFVERNHGEIRIAVAGAGRLDTNALVGHSRVLLNAIQEIATYAQHR